MTQLKLNGACEFNRFKDDGLNSITNNPQLSQDVGLFVTTLFFNCCYLLIKGHAHIDKSQRDYIPRANIQSFGLYGTKDLEEFGLPNGQRRSIPRFTLEEWEIVAAYFMQYGPELTPTEKLQRCGGLDYVVAIFDVFAKYVPKIGINASSGGRLYEIPTSLAHELTTTFNQTAAKVYGTGNSYFQ